MESCTATEIRCATNVSQVRADHVVSSYSEEVSLLLRQSVGRLAQHAGERRRQAAKPRPRKT